MLEKRSMDDVIFLLPGIMGSVLKKDSNTLWSMPESLAPAVTGFTTKWDPLYLRNDDPEKEILDDGIIPTGLMRGIFGIPKFKLSQGYQYIIQAISKQFDVTISIADEDGPANLVLVPYDWRRDNRVSAKRLHRVVTKRLRAWQTYRGTTKPRAILIGHSMGGLVARYYLEVLGGWEYCRALITLGTPHRGSVKALDSLCNQHTLGNANLTELVRSFTSVHQLLPIYESVHIGSTLRRPAELEGFPGLSKSLATDALAFHHEIRDGVKRRDLSRSYPVFPIIGTHQKTPQSAVVEGGYIRLRNTLPRQTPNLQDMALLTDGDGTVPYISAIPVELSPDYRDTCYPEQHSWLPANPDLLDKLCDLLTRIQVADFVDSFQGGEPLSDLAQAPALRLEIDELHDQDTSIPVRVQIINQRADPGYLQLTLEGGQAPLARQILTYDGDAWIGTLAPLPSGLYSVRVETYFKQDAPPAIHTVFGVAALQKA